MLNKLIIVCVFKRFVHSPSISVRVRLAAAASVFGLHPHINRSMHPCFYPHPSTLRVALRAARSHPFPFGAGLGISLVDGHASGCYGVCPVAPEFVLLMGTLAVVTGSAP